MWILSFLPDSFIFWIINLILVLGLIGTLSSFFIRFIPFLFPYATPIKITGIVLLVIGVWFRGGYDVEMAWRDRVNEMQAKIAVAEQKSKEANKEINKKVSDKIKNIKDNVNVNYQAIEANRNAINAECKLSDTAWMLYNRASQNAVAGSTSKPN
jgi:Na+/phosphate symporter